MKPNRKMMGWLLAAACFFLASFLLVNPVAAQSLISNGSFENGTCVPSFSTYGTGSIAITGWQVVAGDVNLICGYWTSAEGARSIDLNGELGAGAIAQTFATTVGQKYQVRFAFAGNPVLGAKIVRMRVTAATSAAEFSFDTTGKSQSDIGWVERYFPFTATSATTTLKFESLSTEFCCTGPALDNVRVEEAPNLTFNTATTSSFSGTCTINGVPTLVTAQGQTAARGTAPTQILSRDNGSLLATFAGSQQVQENYVVTIGNSSGTASGTTSNTFAGIFDTATQSFPFISSAGSGPSLSTTVNGIAITSFTLGTVTGISVNSIIPSTNPAFPEDGSTFFFDITLTRPLTLGGLNCTLQGGTTSGVNQGMAKTVEIDIKPGSNPNSINLGNNGVIPVAILTTPAFNAADVDPTTVWFGKTGVEAKAVQYAQQDVDGDGDLDLILHFNTQQTGITCGLTSAVLTGKTIGGQSIYGKDAIVTVSCQ
ncbi:MAG TPA: choice-of-anchor C family protein [Blastocatellia bacterium]|nr:choice-of-anchor C family protein [Blastocatellia bacterium]